MFNKMVKTTNPIEKVFNERAEAMGNHHLGSGLETPLRDDAFDLSDDEKMELIEENFFNILHTLGMDLNDDSLKDTPRRVAKMFVKEIFQGLNPVNMPEISVFENGYEYSRMLVEKNITVKSTCEHHFLPIIGKAHVGYISNGKVIGLSKLNRIVDYFARRPQVQERMTKQILVALQGALDTQDVIVVIEAKHMCVSLRGIEDDSSTTVTLEYSGAFEEQHARNEFLGYVRNTLLQ
jgi:GTP cyclohydrolase I